MSLISDAVAKALGDAQDWDQRYLKAQVRAIALSSEEDQRELIEEFLAPEAAGKFRATNPYSKEVHLATLMQVLVYQFNRRLNGGNRGNPDREVRGTAFAFATFTDKAWATSDKDIQFDLDIAKRRVRNALRGLEYVARFEAAYYVNEFHTQDGKTGRLVLFHSHALVWSSSEAKIRRARDKFGHRFAPVAHGNSGMHISSRKPEDVPGTLGYMGKMNTLGYRTIKKGDRWTQGPARLRPVQHFRLFNWMKNHSLFDFWFAGGGGVEPLRRTRSAILKRKLPVRRIR